MTTDPGDSQPLTAFLTLAVHENAIYAVSADQGELFPIYVFAPLQRALLRSTPDVPPLAPAWEPYVRDFVQLYKPLPALDASLLPFQLREEIGQQVREGDPTSPPLQATFRLWPLYYCRPGLNAVEHADQPFMFHPAALGLVKLYGHAGTEEPPVTFPPPTLGP